MVQMMFGTKKIRLSPLSVYLEQLEVPALYVEVPGKLDVYASGRNTAITLNIGMSFFDIYARVEVLCIS